MKIYWAGPQLVFISDNRFSSTGWAVSQSVRYIFFRLKPSYLSATSHTGRKSCRAKSLYMKRFCANPSRSAHPHPAPPPVRKQMISNHVRYAGTDPSLLPPARHYMIRSPGRKSSNHLNSRPICEKYILCNKLRLS
jgi:hypothetical protein